MAQTGWKLVGHCPVDSGQLMVSDPCYLDAWKDNDFTGDDEKKNDFSYNGACSVTVRDTAGQLFNWTNQPISVVTSTAGGDGVFPVYVRFEFGTPMELRVMLDGALLDEIGEVIRDY